MKKIRHAEQRSPSKNDLLSLKEQLEAIQMSGVKHEAIIGFDGFVDRIQKAVKKKEGNKNAFFGSMRDFADHIGKLAGKSGQIELVTLKTKAGGNAPILSATLGALNIKSFCIGSMGFPTLNPLFEKSSGSVEMLSIKSPGDSRAIEFSDGKLILSDLSEFADYDWNYIKRSVDLDNIRNRVRTCDLVALVDWSNLPYATNIWQGLLHDVIQVVNRKDLKFLFDLCDPSRKNPSDVKELLNLLSSYSSYGKVTLALNENECTKINMALGNHGVHKTQGNVLVESGSAIFNSTTIDTLLIHPIDRVLAFQKNGILEIKGRLVREPKIQTGGGDNFNAGYCLGMMNNFSLDQCMLLGIVTSGTYIQNGNTPGLGELINYLNNWEHELAEQAVEHA